MPQNSRVPIEANPLRQPGQSVRQQQSALLLERLLPIGTIIFVLWFVAAMEWAWTSSALLPHPVIWTAFAALITLYGLIRSWPLISRLRHLERGYRGERAVGAFLDRLRILGYHVFHDVPGEGGNVDHVIISTRGIYTIETNARDKPPGKVLYDGKAVSSNGGAADPAPVIRARAQADQFRRLLREITGRQLEVRPMLVYPGRVVEQTEAAGSSDVLVLSPNGLYKRINREPEAVPPDAVRQAARQLAAFIRKHR